MSLLTPYDTGYKLLFSHPEMVRDLLIGYMPGERLNEGDFTSLNRVNGSYVIFFRKKPKPDVHRVSMKPNEKSVADLQFRRKQTFVFGTQISGPVIQR